MAYYWHAIKGQWLLQLADLDFELAKLCRLETSNLPKLADDMIRRKREDDCIDCVGREWAASDYTYIRYSKEHANCTGKNVMVCKDCKAYTMEGVSLHEFSGGYEVWCFDAGIMRNMVNPLSLLSPSPLAVKHRLNKTHSPVCTKKNFIAQQSISHFWSVSCKTIVGFVHWGTFQISQCDLVLLLQKALQRHKSTGIILLKSQKTSEKW